MAKRTRKQNREGTIYFDEKSGSWRGELSWVDKSGKLQRKSWKSKRQNVIKVKMNEFKKQLLLNEGNCAPSSIVFEDYANHWLETVLKPQLKQSSFARKEVTLQNQVYPYIGRITMANISSNDIKSMVTQLSNNGLSYSTIKKAYEAVNACFKAYISWCKPHFSDIQAAQIRGTMSLDVCCTPCVLVVFRTVRRH